MPTPMTKKIYSNLDLTKSLNDFKKKVTKPKIWEHTLAECDLPVPGGPTSIIPLGTLSL